MSGVVGACCKTAVRNELKFGKFHVDGLTFSMQSQGSTALCGLCMLNNLLNYPDQSSIVFSTDDLDKAADLLWMRQATILQNLQEELTELRSVNGNCSAQVLETAAEQKGYRLKRLDGGIGTFFKSNALLSRDAQSEYSSFKDAIQCGQIGLCLKGKHYVVLRFLSQDIVLIDSRRRAAVKLDMSSRGLDFLKRCFAEDGFAAFQLICDEICVIDLETSKDSMIDLEDPGFVEQQDEILPQLPFKKIWHDKSLKLESIVSSDIVKLNVKDLRTLSYGSCINDITVDYVRKLINSNVADVYVVDPIKVEKLIIRRSCFKRYQDKIPPDKTPPDKIPRTKSPWTKSPLGQNPPRTKSPWTKSPQYILYFIDSNIFY